MARATKNEPMTYYEKLVREINKSMEEHPLSMVVMDSSNFKVIATGKDTNEVSRKVNKSKGSHGISVVFQRPSDNAVWILVRNIVP